MKRRKTQLRPGAAASKKPPGNLKSDTKRRSKTGKNRLRLILGVSVISFVAAMAVVLPMRHRTAVKTVGSPAAQAVEIVEPVVPYSPRPAGTITFNKDIAPIVFSRCASCHHSGQTAPFELLTYGEISKRGKQIVDVTQTNYMPPWLPEHGYGQFANERRLSSTEKGLIKQWVADGAPEGVTAPPPAPEYPNGWILGKPDLVVTMPDEYVLGADGPDIYRNFVIPAHEGMDHYVRAMEFSPGNSRIVHHAFVKVDSKGASRLLDGKDGAPGFLDMSVPAEMPIGQFLTWQPGKQPSVSPDGLSWLLPKNSDFVVQAHLKRSGKKERFRPSIGLYFTNAPPTKPCVRTVLTSLALDIPAGDSNYVVNDSMTLPADVEVLSVLPHAHYLAREMRSFAVLPDGTTKWLLFIKHWNFRWQGDYPYEQPVFLPKGTTVNLQFTYDNSTNNPDNPNPTPKRVMYGPQSSDEMCELWFQMATTNEAAVLAVQGAENEHMKDVFRRHAEHRLEVDPNDANAHVQMGIVLFGEGKNDEALAHFSCAEQLEPNLDEAHYQKGVVLRFEHRLADSRTELETALRLNPKNSQAYGHLGFVLANQGDAADAERCFTECLQLDPDDSMVQQALEQLRQIRARRRLQ
jgi:hypothetical protein